MVSFGSIGVEVVSAGVVGASGMVGSVGVVSSGIVGVEASVDELAPVTTSSTVLRVRRVR